MNENKILLIKKEIDELEEKKKQLEKLQLNYYNEYFDIVRDDFALLKDIPINPNYYSKHVLYDHSVLNVDTIGKIICELIRKYDKESVVSKRIIKNDKWENAFGYYCVEVPILVIGKENTIDKMDKDAQNIIIEYDNYYDLEDYPTNNPVSWMTSEYGEPYKKSNYNRLVGYQDGLNFKYPSNQEYIRELIYSLSYYQKKHDIKIMGSKDTWYVYRKIYKK